MVNATDQIQSRYSGLCCSTGSLSCGNALETAAVQRGEIVVDLGSGRGQDVIKAAGKVGTSGRAIGIDITDAMIETARKAVPPMLTNVQFVKSDLEHLLLDDASCDVVISNCTINHAADKGQVYREIFRILKPGGRFVVSDVLAEQELPDEVKNDPEAWAACYGGAVTEQAYLAAVTGAGFDYEIISKSAPYEKGGVSVLSMTLRGIKPV